MEKESLSPLFYVEFEFPKHPKDEVQLEIRKHSDLFLSAPKEEVFFEESYLLTKNVLDKDIAAFPEEEECFFQNEKEENERPPAFLKENNIDPSQEKYLPLQKVKYHDLSNPPSQKENFSEKFFEEKGVFLLPKKASHSE